jgi:O-antigen/teichoic acid export membrane protein
MTHSEQYETSNQRDDGLSVFERSGVKTSFWDYLALLSSNLILIPLGVVSVTLATRILGPEGYGYITLFTLVTTFVVMSTTNWTASSLLRFGREEYDQTGRLNHTFWARTIIAIPSLLVGSLAIYLSRGFINEYLEMPSWTIWLLIGSVFVITGRGFLDNILQAVHRMKMYAVTQVMFTVGSIVGLTLIAMGFFPKAYLSVIVVGLLMNAVIVFLMCFFVHTGMVLPVEVDRKIVRDIVTFSYPLLLGNMAAYVVNWMDVIVIKHYLSMSHVGGYQLAYNLFNLFTGVVSSATVLITPILISLLTAKRKDIIVRYCTRLIPQGILIWSTLIGIMLSVSPSIFLLLFGDKFRASTVYFQFLCMGLALSSATYFYSGVITAYKLIKIGVMASVARSVVNVIGDIVLVPMMGPLGAALSTTGGIAVAALCYVVICQRQFQERLLWQLILVLPAFASLGLNSVISGPKASVLSIAVSLATSVCLAKALHLFRAEDLILTDYVQMPTLLKRIVVWAYSCLMTGGEYKGKEVVS